METKFTPGPWRIGQEYDNRRDEIEAADGRTIAIVWTRTATNPHATARPQYIDDEAAKSNARLIAQSPALLECLEHAERIIANWVQWAQDQDEEPQGFGVRDDQYDQYRDAIDCVRNAREAIRAAKGESK